MYFAATGQEMLPEHILSSRLPIVSGFDNDSATSVTIYLWLFRCYCSTRVVHHEPAYLDTARSSHGRPDKVLGWHISKGIQEKHLQKESFISRHGGVYQALMLLNSRETLFQMRHVIYTTCTFCRSVANLGVSSGFRDDEPRAASHNGHRCCIFRDLFETKFLLLDTTRDLSFVCKAKHGMRNS